MVRLMVHYITDKWAFAMYLDYPETLIIILFFNDIGFIIKDIYTLFKKKLYIYNYINKLVLNTKPSLGNEREKNITNIIIIII